MTQKGASLLPSDYVSGGGVGDGEYTLAKLRCVMFDYGGKAEAVPAVQVTFKGVDGAETEQNYSAGKAEFLVPSDDGKRLVHPGGEQAHFAKNSNWAAFATSIINAGFPTALLTDDVTAFEGTKVVITNQAQPKRPGIKDAVEGKTIALVSKIVSLPGTKTATAAPRKAAVPKAAIPAQPLGPAAPAAPQAATNGDVAALAMSTVQEILAGADAQTLSRLKLGTQVMLKLVKDPSTKPMMAEAKKLASDIAWLTEHQEDGSWIVDGDNVTLA